MRNDVLYGDCLTKLKEVPDACVQTCVTSPPYWGLRDYGTPGQIGAEKTPAEYVAKIVAIFREVRRVLREDGTLWLNLGDSYINAKGLPVGIDPKQGARRFGLRPNDVSVPGYKPKDLVGIPWMCAFALREDGWYLRSGIVWNKPNAMPDSVQDRPTLSHEFVFLFAKSRHYYYDSDAIREPLHTGGNPVGAGQPLIDSSERSNTRNKRSVWVINTRPYKGAHDAVMPAELASTCIKAGSRCADLVLDPFAGSGTTLMVAVDLNRDYLGIELNEEYRPLINERLRLASENFIAREGMKLLAELTQDEQEPAKDLWAGFSPTSKRKKSKPKSKPKSR